MAGVVERHGIRDVAGSEQAEAVLDPQRARRHRGDRGHRIRPGEPDPVHRDPQRHVLGERRAREGLGARQQGDAARAPRR